MRLTSPVRVLRSFRNPRWGFEWLAGFLGERTTFQRHRRRVLEYDRRRMSMSAAIARVTSRPQAEVEDFLASGPPFDGATPGVGPGAVRWAGSAELARICYAVSRMMRPELVVETGVGSGMSSLAFLSALDENNLGMLYSVDLPTPNSIDLPSIGHLVPAELKSRWVLTLGSSTRVLPKILDKVRSVDVFLHDSRHSYANQLMEYRLVWPYLRPGGVLISDDVSNDALLETAERQHAELTIVGQSKPYPIGILVKPANQ